MTNPATPRTRPGAILYEHTDIPAGLTIRQWRQDNLARSPRHRRLTLRRLRRLTR